MEVNSIQNEEILKNLKSKQSISNFWYKSRRSNICVVVDSKGKWVANTFRNGCQNFLKFYKTIKKAKERKTEKI